MKRKDRIFIHIAPNLFCLNFLTHTLSIHLEERSVGLLPELLCAESRSLGFSKEDKKAKLFLLVAKYTQCAVLTSAFTSSGFAVTTSRENSKTILFHIH